MIENKSVFSAFAQQFSKHLKLQFDRNIKPAKARELLSLAVGCSSHNQLISQLPRPIEDWQESEALDRLEALLKERHGFVLGANRGLFMQSIIDGMDETEDALDTNLFDVREAWIFCQITDRPFSTKEGDMHVFVLMDAASRYVIAHEGIIDSRVCPTKERIEAMLLKGFEKAGRWPRLLIASKEQLNTIQIKIAAKSFGIEFKKVKESALSGYIDELKEGMSSTFTSVADRIREESAPVDDEPSRAQEDVERERLRKEAEEKIKSDFLAHYYTQWLDSPVPGLGNRTPREASKTEEGRKAIEDLFEYMKKLPRSVPMPDLNDLRVKLGMQPRD